MQALKRDDEDRSLKVVAKEPSAVPGKWTYYMYWALGIGASVAMIIYGLHHQQADMVFSAGGYL